MHYWTTDDRPAAEQFSYWREVVCEAFTPLSADRTDDPPGGDRRNPRLRSWVRASMLVSTNCAEVSSQSQFLRHGRAEVGRTTGEDLFLNLQVRGQCIVSQGDRVCTVPAGSFHVVDSTREFHQHYIEDGPSREWRVISFRLPRERIVPLLADPDGFTAVEHDARAGGIDSVVASTMLATWRNIDRLDRADADAAESAVNTVLAAAAGGRRDIFESRREEMDSALRASVNRYLAANLRGSAPLSAPAVAQRFGISLRKLHSLYEGTERTFARTTMALRVEACAAQLRAGTTISGTELAAWWGFSDLSHLNRAFRAHYGCLPSEFRDIPSTRQGAPRLTSSAGRRRRADDGSAEGDRVGRGPEPRTRGPE
ncbi:helix-turn-helix domain-containing protein [Pseudonocardia alni]|uniref:helix-turn-helix domain-containing protein n=1 Tax=Pseudonocardia alni TaxID=33907 RepID=UPI00280A913C|nr:helix-turn-helix domain-containing protein [Pseudonocardia alni]